jgi:hypothetical protein
VHWVPPLAIDRIVPNATRAAIALWSNAAAGDEVPNAIERSF